MYIDEILCTESWNLWRISFGQLIQVMLEIQLASLKTGKIVSQMLDTLENFISNLND